MNYKKILITIVLFSMVRSVFATNDAVTVEPNVALTEIQSGKVQGFVHNRIFTYRGIPYAKAERFMPPTPAEKWENTRMALTYGDICPQNTANQLANFMFSGPSLTQSENCQNLNIWTPAINDNNMRPVMIWLHGGGFESGSSIENYSYDGENLSRTGNVVVISVNHRLNSMGHLDLSAYGDEYKYSANLGIMDLVSALQWVKENVKQFGGDPNNITLFGESGGGAKVLTLMATPDAKGLFQKAIVQSGAVEQMGMTLLSPKMTQRVAALTLEYLGLNDNQIEQLKIIPYERVSLASQKALDQTAKEQNLLSVMGNGIGLSWAPSMDGFYIPEEPVGEKYPEIAKDIPLLIGTNLTEWTTIFSHFNNIEKAQIENHNTFTSEQVRHKMQEKYGEKYQVIADAFSLAYPTRQNSDALYVDSFLRPYAIKTARLKADQKGANVYQYLFTWDTPILGGFAMSYHTAEIPFVMNSLGLTETAHGNGDEAKILADKMSQAWIAFARTGSPNTDGLPKWDAYTRENGAVMIFDNKPEMRYFHDEKLLKLLQPDLNF